tara:strand:+ start:3619 stop:3828 length:210 start_codon:yes stop_codon:yes gene_type:complete
MIAIIMFGVGFVSGLYVSTQIEKSIDRNIKKNRDSGQEWIRQVFGEPPPTKEIGILKNFYNNLFNKRKK